ncbi:hypothetical protein HHK36_005720 [Tetracentron sinense]|uniref:Uncharacterized protein n=1 Tax=Tetracentron sinense TaxID=13715 RepID=A0A834ZVV9_TETSI|nr:hypothetical protein HHK36_005720 [Tetracentron sinense]
MYTLTVVKGDFRTTAAATGRPGVASLLLGVQGKNLEMVEGRAELRTRESRAPREFYNRKRGSTEEGEDLRSIKGKVIICREALMAVMDARNPLIGETTCGSLLQQLQAIRHL